MLHIRQEYCINVVTIVRLYLMVTENFPLAVFINVFAHVFLGLLFERERLHLAHKSLHSHHCRNSQARVSSTRSSMEYDYSYTHFRVSIRYV